MFTPTATQEEVSSPELFPASHRSLNGDFMKRLIFSTLAGLALAALPLSAQLSAYGYVVGTFVPGSNYLEPLDQQGKFLHYHFKVQTAGGQQYECVIDVKNGHLVPFPYRILPIGPTNPG